MKALEVVNLDRDPLQQESLGERQLEKYQHAAQASEYRTHSLALRACMLVLILATIGCPAKYREDLDYSYDVEQTLALDGVEQNLLVQFQSVDWDADDQVELRSMIIDDNLAAGRTVLQIGVGPGVIPILCQQHGAGEIIATDWNPVAVANAKYNVALMELDAVIKVRKTVDRQSFSAVKSDETFDLIIVDPSAAFAWRHESVDADSSDAEIPTVDSFLDGMLIHSKPGGRCIVACHHKEQIQRWRDGATDRKYEEKILGERDLAALQGEIYPAVLLEIRVPIDLFNAQKKDASE